MLLMPSYAVDEDPFMSLLPGEHKPVPVNSLPEDKSDHEEVSFDAESVSVEGIFWNTTLPRAIIDGEIYKVNDLIPGTNAQITKIEDGCIKVLYQGRIYVLTPQKSSEGGK